MGGVVEADVGVADREPARRAFAAAAHRGLHRDHRAHEADSLVAAEMLLEEFQDLTPAVHRLLLAIERAIVIEEAVAGAIVAMELVVLAVLFQFRLVGVHVGWRWA